MHQSLFQYGDPPVDTPEHLYGIAIFRDFFLSIEKNRPKELQDIYKKHLEEVEESIKDIWDNREKILIDLKIIKGKDLTIRLSFTIK